MATYNVLPPFLRSDWTQQTGHRETPVGLGPPHTALDPVHCRMESQQNGILTEWLTGNWPLPDREIDKRIQLISPIPAHTKHTISETTPPINQPINSPIVGEPLQMNDQHTRQLPQVKLLRGLYELLTLWTVPGIVFTKFLSLCEKVKAVVEGQFLRGFRGHVTTVVLLYSL